MYSKCAFKSLLNKLPQSLYLHRLPGVMHIIMLPFTESLLCVACVAADRFIYIISCDPHRSPSGVCYVTTIFQKTRLNNSGPQSELQAELDMESKPI